VLVTGSDPNRPGGGIEPLRLPLVTRLSPEGVVSWTWSSGIESNQVSALDARLGASGQVFVMSAESAFAPSGFTTPDPHRARTLPLGCSVYGCTAATVRRLSASGELESEFSLRSVQSEPIALGVEEDGVYVATILRGEEVTMEIWHFR
jgi:hypothetical protein